MLIHLVAHVAEKVYVFYHNFFICGPNLSQIEKCLQLQDVLS